MAELADALVLGASGQPCEFESHWPHSLQKRDNFSIHLLDNFRQLRYSKCVQKSFGFFWSFQKLYI